MSWYHFFFFKEKQVPKTALRSIRIFIPIFSPPRSTGSEMKIDTQAGDPKAGSSTREQCLSQTCGSIPSRSGKQTETHYRDLPTRIESKRHFFFFFGYKVYCIFLSLLSFLKIIYLFYFTTLYWFCHTLTWICFNLSSLCTGWPKCLFKIFQSNLWPSWSFWPTQ